MPELRKYFVLETSPCCCSPWCVQPELPSSDWAFTNQVSAKPPGGESSLTTCRSHAWLPQDLHREAEGAGDAGAQAGDSSAWTSRSTILGNTMKHSRHSSLTLGFCLSHAEIIQSAHKPLVGHHFVGTFESPEHMLVGLGTSLGGRYGCCLFNSSEKERELFSIQIYMDQEHFQTLFFFSRKTEVSSYLSLGSLKPQCPVSEKTTPAPGILWKRLLYNWYLKIHPCFSHSLVLKFLNDTVVGFEQERKDASSASPATCAAQQVSLSLALPVLTCSQEGSCQHHILLFSIAQLLALDICAVCGFFGLPLLSSYFFPWTGTPYIKLVYGFNLAEGRNLRLRFCRSY